MAGSNDTFWAALAETIMARPAAACFTIVAVAAAAVLTWMCWRWRAASRMSDAEMAAATDAIVRSVDDTACLDSSRLRFVRDAAETLVKLVNHDLRGRDRYKRLLLGRKAVGKTTLLMCLQQVAEQHLARRGLVCVLVDYSNTDGALPPLAHVVRRLGVAWYAWYRLLGLWCTPHELIVRTEQAIRTAGITIFGVVDEFQNVYKRDCPNGMAIVNQLAGLGSSKEGVMHWVLSGSSSDLRALVTAKLPQSQFQLFPNYVAKDLNGSKFVPRSIFPFLDPSDFRKLVAFHGGSGDDADLGKLYLLTGGVAGAVSDSVTRKDAAANTYAVSCKGLGADGATDLDSVLLRQLMIVVRACTSVTPDGDDERALETFARWTHLVPFADVEQSVRSAHPSHTGPMILNAMYRLADRGLVRVDDTTQHVQVSLGSPTMMQQLWNEPAALSPEEMIAMRTGNAANIDSAVDLAGNVTLRLIAHNAREASAASTFGFRIAGAGGSSVEPVQELVVGQPLSFAPGDAAGRMWKEGYRAGRGGVRDALGADGVVLERSSGSTFVAHRIQVKLWQGDLTVEQAAKFVQRFKTNVVQAADAYAAAGLQVAQQRLILATTLNVLPAAAEWLRAEHSDIVLWDKQFLAQHVWPNSVQVLHKRFRAARNASSVGGATGRAGGVGAASTSH